MSAQTRSILEMTVGEALRVAKKRLARLFRRKPAAESASAWNGYDNPNPSWATRKPAPAMQGVTAIRMAQQQAAFNQQAQAAYAQLQAMQNRGSEQAPVNYGQPPYGEMTQVAISAFPFLHSGVFHPNLPPRWPRR